jgi:large subunit ribosomal protein L13e
MHHIKPIITMQNGKQRTGKGFSPDEIKKAGLNRADAKTLGIPVDTKRKTAHEENINTIKSHWEKHQAEAKPKPVPEKPVESKKKSKS